MAHCLAKRRDGSPCSLPPLDGSRQISGQSRYIFCKMHDEEYCLLLKQYSIARLQCRKFHWLFDLSIDCFVGESSHWLRFAQQEAEPALAALNRTSNIRAIRLTRFAAAFDEFANDESIASMKSMAAKCRLMLRICATQLEKERLSKSGFWEVLADVFCCCCVARPLRSRVVVVRSLDSADVADQSRMFYSDRNPADQLTRDIQNLASLPITEHIKDPVRAVNTARKKTLLSKLRAFMSSDRALVNHLSSATISDIKGAVFRRIIYDDKVMLRKCRDSILGIEAFMNCIMTVDDLELLWTQITEMTPVTLRDALVDLESQKQGLSSTTLLGRHVVLQPLECPLTLRGWETLYALLGGNLTYDDVYFLSSNATEFLDISAHITANPQIFGRLLSSDTPGNDPFSHSLRLLGFVPLPSMPQSTRGTLQGIMRDCASTRRFIHACLARNDVSLRADLPDGSVLQNNEGIFGSGRRDATRRTGRFFLDGCAIQIIVRNEGENWHHPVVRFLARSVTGRKCL